MGGWEEGGGGGGGGLSLDRLKGSNKGGGIAGERERDLIIHCKHMDCSTHNQVRA